MSGQDSLDTDIAHGRQLFLDGHAREALAVAMKATRTCGRSAALAELLAEIWLSLGRADLSLDWARTLNRIEPGPYAEALVNRASWALKHERARLLEASRSQRRPDYSRVTEDRQETVRIIGRPTLRPTIRRTQRDQG